MGIFGPNWNDFLALQSQVETNTRAIQSMTPKIDQILSRLDTLGKTLTGVSISQSNLDTGVSEVLAKQNVLNSGVDAVLIGQGGMMRDINQISTSLGGSLDKLILEAKTHNANFESLISVVEGLAKSVKKLTRPPDPGRLSLSIVEELMGSVLKYDVELPVAADAAEVQGGELTVTLAGSDPVVISTLAGQAKVEGLEGPQDSGLVLSFVFIDDAGNKSTTASVLDTTLRDTIPPEDPGALGITVTGETQV